MSHARYIPDVVSKVEERMKWFRVRNKRQIISIMEMLQEKHLLKYKIVGQRNIVKYCLFGWAKYNVSLNTMHLVRKL